VTARDLINVALTPLGETLRGGTVLFRGLNAVCSNTDDWRHWLPVYIHRFTGANIVVWNTLQQKICRHCPSSERYKGTRPCQSLLGRRKVDMLVVVGAGRYSRGYTASVCSRGSPGLSGTAPAEAPAPPGRHLFAASPPAPDAVGLYRSHTAPPIAGATCRKQFPFMKRLLRTPWANRLTYKVHFPISTLHALNGGNVFGFHKVIGDESFLKPIGLTAAAKLDTCISGQKDKTLLYIARYLPSKGLNAFLGAIDPEVLAGYKVHVLGEVNSLVVKERAMKTARARKLPVVFHDEVTKEEVLKRLCAASGVVLYAERDKNPRVAYEGLYAGAPVFVTDSSGLPAGFLAQPFVKTTHFGDGNLNADFASYMADMVEQPTRMATEIRRYINGDLYPTRVYLGICQRMGICA